MKTIKGGITKPQGYTASGIHCGIKRSKKRDLTLIVSDTIANAAGVFTKNSIKAAPVVLSQKHIRNNKIQAIICNSGNANCFTGKFGYYYAEHTSILTGLALDIDPKNVIVSSTGIIGQPLPFIKIKKGIKKLVQGLSVTGSKKAAEGILTTDKKTKESAVSLTLNGKKVIIGGCAKGSGMVEPNMATMLAFITTDAAVSPKVLKSALKKAVDKTFNCITIDGCMSTNDMVVIMANGQSNSKPLASSGKELKKFQEALNYVCLDLAKKIVLDAEGATKFIEVHVQGAKTTKQAKTAAKTIANSVLVKTAAFGNNPNWGRIAQAVGSLGIKGVNENTLRIALSDFSKDHIQIHVDLQVGQAEETVFTCDLSYDYVKINGDYN